MCFGFSSHKICNVDAAILTIRQTGCIYIFFTLPVAKIAILGSNFITTVAYTYFYFSACKNNAKIVMPAKTFLFNIFLVLFIFSIMQNYNIGIAALSIWAHTYFCYSIYKNCNIKRVILALD